MGWGEYVYFGTIGREKDCSIEEYLIHMAKKIGMDKVFTQSEDSDDIIKDINHFLFKKYDFDVDIVHSNYHGHYSYVAIGININGYMSDELINIGADADKLRDLFKIIGIDKEPKIVKTDYINDILKIE